MSADEVKILFFAVTVFLAIVLVLRLRSLGSMRVAVKGERALPGTHADGNKVVVSSAKYTLPAAVMELVRDGKDAEAIAAIQAATHMDEDRAGALLKQLKEAHRDGSGHQEGVHTEKHSYKLSQVTLDLIRSGKMEEAVERFGRESGVSAEQSLAIIKTVAERLGPL